MRRLLLLVIAAALLCTATSSAQIGRIRSAVTNVARGQQQPGKPAQMVIIPITPQVVTSFEKALSAREQEMQRLARENSPTGQYFAAVLRRDSLERRRQEYKAGRGPDFDREQALQARVMQGDTTAIPALTHVRDFMNINVEMPAMDWNAQMAANAHMDTVMMQAAGFSAGEWAYVADKVPPVASYTAHSGAAADSVVERLAQTFNITPAEVRAVAARRIEIARAFGWSYSTDAEIAKANEAAAAESTQDDPTKNYNACMVEGLKPVQEEAERRKAELEAAQKAGDMAKLVDFANRVTAAQQAAALKCAPLLNQ